MAMTLGHQSNMYNIFQHQQHTPPQGNCVIVSSAAPAAMGNAHLTASKTVIQGKRPLAPATERGSVLVSSNGDHLRCKRKIQFMPHVGAPQPASVARRNARERNRVKQVNNGFATLRQHIPETVCATLSPQSASSRGANKKLSKVETLRMAVEYIRSLQRTIEDHDMDLASNSGSDNNHHDSSSYYSMSPTASTINHSFSYPLLLAPPTCSEASTSPTPSQSSDSFGSHSVHSFNNSQDYQNENYDPNDAEDEELLDCIFSWQNE